MGGSEPSTETIDYSKFDPKFTNTVESVGPVWGEIHERRLDWIAKNRQSYTLEPEIPDDLWISFFNIFLSVFFKVHEFMVLLPFKHRESLSL